MEKIDTPVTEAMASMIPPPPVDVACPEGPYDPEKDALSDIPGLRYALDLFLSSHMVEAENFCLEMDPAR